jgi:hypothetical protein
MPKQGEPDSSWEDAVDFDRGVAAICDGASAGIYCKNWADVLARGFVHETPALDDPAARSAWIRACREQWRGMIDFERVRPLALNKINFTGAAATFLGLRVGLPLAGDSGDVSTLRWVAWSVGDACLLHVRDGRLHASFPMVCSEDFGISPTLFRTVPAAGIPAPVLASGTLVPGDVLVLATDAIAQYLLACEERGEPCDYTALWNADQDSWRAQIQDLRNRREIVDDDCTLLLLRVADPPERRAALSEPEPQGVNPPVELDVGPV